MTTPAGSRSLDAWPPVHLVASLAMRSIEAGEDELSMRTKMVDKITKDLDLRLYHDGYKEWLRK